jgi:hypothetical protein
MKRTAVVLLLLLPLAGCSGLTIIISPSNTSSGSGPAIRPSPTTPAPLRPIRLGETVEGTLSWSHPADEFDVTAIADGTLVVRLRWDVQHTSTILLVNVDGAEFRSRAPDWSPVVARVPATRGRQYRLRVALQGSDWIPDDLYHLTTSVE